VNEILSISLLAHKTKKQQLQMTTNNPTYILSTKEIHALSNTLQDKEIGLRTGNHYINFRSYPDTFTGVDIVRWLTNHDIVINKEDAMVVCAQLLVMRRIVAAAGKSFTKIGTNDTQTNDEHHEIFVDDRNALYHFTEGGHTEQPRRVRMRLKKADSTMFSKGSWSGFKGGRKKVKKKLSKREKLQTLDDVSDKHKNVRKAHRKLTKIVQRRRSVEAFAEGETALEMAVDQGFDYREVLVPPHVPIYGTSDGCVYRERQENESAPPKYQFHYDIASTRRSSSRSSATVTVPKTNQKMQRRVLFFMMGETEKARANAINELALATKERDLATSVAKRNSMDDNSNKPHKHRSSVLLRMADIALLE